MARTWEELDYCLDECKYQSVLFTKKPVDFTHSQQYNNQLSKKSDLFLHEESIKLGSHFVNNLYDVGFLNG